MRLLVFSARANQLCETFSLALSSPTELATAEQVVLAVCVRKSMAERESSVESEQHERSKLDRDACILISFMKEFVFRMLVSLNVIANLFSVYSVCN